MLKFIRTVTISSYPKPSWERKLCPVSSSVIRPRAIPSIASRPFQVSAKFTNPSRGSLLVMRSPLCLPQCNKACRVLALQVWSILRASVRGLACFSRPLQTNVFLFWQWPLRQWGRLAMGVSDICHASLCRHPDNCLPRIPPDLLCVEAVDLQVKAVRW